jgi:flagellar motor switch protein FliN
MNEPTEIRLESYLQAWSSSLALLLSRMTATKWQTAAADAPGDHAPVTTIAIEVAGKVSGRQDISLAAADLSLVLTLFLGEEVSIGAELDEMQRESVEELLRQWAGLAASALKPDFGELTLAVSLATTAAGADGTVRFLRASGPTQSIALRVALDDSLSGALLQPEPASEPIPQALPDHAPLLPGNPSSRIEELLRQGNLELLMDVELPVMLHFGSRQATLHEVLELATGAVLELDHEVHEPVDLMLNGKLIARGEVVVVDGNYGLRVMEVVSPQQRISSL